MTLINFIFENIWLFLIGVIAFTILFLSILKWRKNARPSDKQIAKLKREYESSIFYQKTNIPFDNILNKDSVDFARYRVFKELNRINLSKKEFFFDLEIPTGNSNGTSLDMVMLSSCGLFVYKILNLNHVVTGNVDEDKWTAVSFNKKSIEELEWIDNPIIHLQRNLEAVKRMNPLNIECHAYVVYVGDAAFESENPTMISIVSNDNLLRKMSNDLEVESVNDDKIRYMCRVLSEYQNEEQIKTDDILTSPDDDVLSEDVENLNN